MRIFITHCSRSKENSIRDSGKAVAPDKLYTAIPTQLFMHKCKEEKVQWAIFSDLYGVWFPDIEHVWYEKDPDTVTTQEFVGLVLDFDQKLQGYDEIWFYYDPNRFHPLYERLLRQTKLKARLRMFSDISSISNEKE